LSGREDYQDVPELVRQYKQSHPVFAHISTAVQFFDCVRVEAYQQLSELLIIGML
jgi:hypothetical protein